MSKYTTRDKKDLTRFVDEALARGYMPLETLPLGGNSIEAKIMCKTRGPGGELAISVFRGTIQRNRDGVIVTINANGWPLCYRPE